MHTLVRWLFLVSLFFSCGFLGAQKPIEILIPDYPPFSGAPGSLWQIILDKAFETQGYQVTYQVMPLERMKFQVRTGKNPVFVNSLLVLTPQDSRDLIPSGQVFHQVDVGVFYNRQKYPQGFSGPLGLKGANLGTLLGTGAVTFLQNQGLKQETSTSVEFLFKKLASGRIDGAVVADLTGWQALVNLKMRPEDYGFSVLYSSSIDGIFSKAYPQGLELKKVFQRGISMISKNGQLLSILQRFYPPGIWNPKMNSK